MASQGEPRLVPPDVDTTGLQEPGARCKEAHATILMAPAGGNQQPLALAACANSNKSPPRDPRDPPYHSWRGLVHTNHTRCAESRNGCIQRISGPPSDPEIRHVALAAVPAANLGPGTRPEPAPTTHGGSGRNSTGGWLADDPQGVPPRPRMCGGGMVQRESPESGGGAGWPAGCHPTSIPALHSCPGSRYRVGRN